MPSTIARTTSARSVSNDRLRSPARAERLAFGDSDPLSHGRNSAPRAPAGDAANDASNDSKPSPSTCSKHVLDGLAGDPVLGPHEVRAGLGRRHRQHLVVEVDVLALLGVEQHRGRADRQPAPPRRERAGCVRAGVAVVHRGVDDGGRRQSQLHRDVRQQRPHRFVQRPQRREPGRVDAGQPQQLRVVRRDAQRPVVAHLRHEHRALVGDAPAGEPQVHEVHRLEVRGGGPVDLRPVDAGGGGCAPATTRRPPAGSRAGRGTPRTPRGAGSRISHE